MPAEAALLTMERQVIDEAIRDDLRNQARSGDSAWDWRGWLRRRDDVLLREPVAAFQQLRLAGIFLLNVPHNVQARWLPFVLLGDLLADRHQLAVTGQSLLLALGQIVNDIDPLQMVGLRPAAVARSCAVIRFRLDHGGRRECRCRFLRRRAKQQQLQRVDLFTAAAVETPQQQVHVMLQLAQLRVLPAQSLQELQHQLPQRGRVVRQRTQIRKWQSIRAHVNTYTRERKKFRPAQRRIPKISTQTNRLIPGADNAADVSRSTTRRRPGASPGRSPKSSRSPRPVLDAGS